MSNIYRYLLNLSYIGTPFRGAQRQLQTADDHLTVQGKIEIALRALRPVNDICVTTSSRTDTGVHALHTTMHTDLQRKNGETYATKDITYQLNKYFAIKCIPIRIISTFLVPNDFHCRNAMSRTYLYRLVINKTEIRNSLACHLPIEEFNRAFYKNSTNFDFKKFQSAAQLFKGHHDFRSFMSKERLKPDKITRRVITKFDATISESKVYSALSLPDLWMKSQNSFLYVDVVIESSGFLYRQVRRMIAAVLGASEDKITEEDIQRMLTIPSRHSWDSRLKTAPAEGLYLARVTYSPETIATFRETTR